MGGAIKTTGYFLGGFPKEQEVEQYKFKIGQLVAIRGQKMKATVLDIIPRNGSGILSGRYEIFWLSRYNDPQSILVPEEALEDAENTI